MVKSRERRSLELPSPFRLIAKGEGATGTAFLAGVIAGYEACSRVANAVQPSHWRRGFLSMCVRHIWRDRGCRINSGFRGPRRHRTRWACRVSKPPTSTAASMARATWAATLPGHAASTGIMSALLAQRGFTGCACRKFDSLDQSTCQGESHNHALDAVLRLAASRGRHINRALWRSCRREALRLIAGAVLKLC